MHSFAKALNKQNYVNYGMEFSPEAFRSDRKLIASFFSKLSEGFAYGKIIDEKSTDFVYLNVNDAFGRIMGKTRESIVGKRNSEIFPEIDKDPESQNVLRLYVKVALTGENERFERYATHIDKWLNVLVYSPMRGYFAALIEDITERKKAEEALRESEQRLRFHAENIPLAVVEWDNNFVVIRWAGDAEKMFGWTAAETLGKTIMDLRMIYEPDIPIVEKTMGRLTSGETKVVSSNRNITKDGRVIYCTWYNSVLLDEKGKMSSVFSFVEECTARVRAEKALEENNRNLEQLVDERTRQLKDAERLAAIGATAGMVGHDIRNPLQAITGDVYLAKTELAAIPQSEEKKNALESLTEIEKNIDYINKIVQDLQDYARPLNPQAEEADLKLIVEKLLTKNGLPENVKVSVKVENEARKISADSYYLNRILYNLVTNSVQAMPKGGKLTVHAFKEANDLVITVKTPALAFLKRVQGKMFTPMFTTKSKGQGFGLPVVKRMTESLGGTVTFESQENKGTTFIVRLPTKK